MTYRLATALVVIVLSVFASGVLAEDIGGAPAGSPAPAMQSVSDGAAAQPAADSAAPAAPAVEGGDAASDGAGAEGEAVGDGASEDGNKTFPMLPLLIVAAVLLFMMTSGKKKDKKAKEMLANLKKGDRVTTIGGIVGSVLEVSEHEVRIKVDESTNARMDIARWAIRTVGTPDQETEK